jgi:predicted NBD/HSP70 family sugar kinase
MVVEQGDALSIETIKLAADASDEIALAILSETGMIIGQGIASLINIFNPEKIILGGPLSIAGNHLLAPIRKAIEEHAFPFSNPNLEIQLSDFGPDASLVGAFAVVVENILSNPSSVQRR